MKKVFLLLSTAMIVLSCSDEKALLSMQTELEATKAELESLKTQTMDKAGMIHNVFFWLNEDISEADRNAFLEGVKSLGTISSVKAFYIGPPSATEARDVVENSFSYALLVHFENVEGQNAYQIDPIHLKFVEDHKDKWTKVVVYDNDVIQ